MAWRYDPKTGAYYDDADADAPIKLSTTESFISSKSWLWLALGFLILVAAKRR